MTINDGLSLLPISMSLPLNHIPCLNRTKGSCAEFNCLGTWLRTTSFGDGDIVSGVSFKFVYFDFFSSNVGSSVIRTRSSNSFDNITL